MSHFYFSNRHSRCDNYQQEGKNNFAQRRLNFNEKYELQGSDNYCFIFVIEGSIRIRDDNFDEILEENNVYSLGYDVCMSLHSLSESHFLLLRFTDPNILCTKFEITELEQFLPETTPIWDVVALSMETPVRLLVQSIIFYLNHKILCRHLLNLKLGEWFFVMQHYYTKKQNAAFFYPLIKQNDSFEVMVRERARKVTTVNELADACHMTPKTLTRKFKRVFNETPKQWLLQQKKEQVMMEFLLTDNKKELPEKLGFSSYSHLNYYCIRQFGKSLKEM